MEPKGKLGEAQALTEQLLDKLKDAAFYAENENKGPTTAWVYRRFMEQINKTQRVISQKSTGVFQATLWIHSLDDPDADKLKATARQTIFEDIQDSLKRKPTKSTQPSKDNT